MLQEKKAAKEAAAGARTVEETDAAEAAWDTAAASMTHDGFDGMEPSRVAYFAKLEKITFPEQSSHYDSAPCTLRVYDFAFKGWVIFFESQIPPLGHPSLLGLSKRLD